MTMLKLWKLLPQDLIELQLGQIDLLSAMYPEEITLEESSQTTIDMLRGCSKESQESFFESAPSISLLLELTISTVSGLKTLELDFTAPFTWEGNEPPEEPPQVKVRTRQPPWLSKAATNQLIANLSPEEDLLETIEHIKEAATQQLEQAQSAFIDSPSNSQAPSKDLVRVWFYFPSISTRSKRDDFILHAPTHSLTGFLYAGKPGLLCVEGASQSIDDYMKFIKTESWGDIPAHHKKVSERYRETAGVVRVFGSMTEITDVVGERRGQRVNRGDMKAVEEWLVERGLGEAFGKVLM
ncbi:hypothetical protein GQ44DRAFT_641699, partial [Phaeosphaeriaceae sp. PMI808]